MCRIIGVIGCRWKSYAHVEEISKLINYTLTANALLPCEACRAKYVPGSLWAKCVVGSMWTPELLGHCPVALLSMRVSWGKIICLPGKSFGVVNDHLEHRFWDNSDNNCLSSIIVWGLIQGGGWWVARIFGACLECFNIYFYLQVISLPIINSLLV